MQGTRALHAIGIGGTVEVGGSTFEDNSGGAVVAAAGSQVHISHSVLVRNTAAEGGAISVAGAATTLHLVGTRIALNVATARGGGLHVAGGVVTLDNRTVLEDNRAPEGHTMQLLGGATSYFLPAPAGRWVNTAVLDPVRGTLVSAVALGSHVEDYPFACREGHFGSDEDVSTQLNPDCVGPCPRGKICPGATHTPLPCTVGSYCPQGSAAGTFCPPGYVGYGTNLAAKEECDLCPPGYVCEGGSATACARSYYNPLAGQYLRSACLSCPSSTTTASSAATSVGECLCNKGYYNSRSASNNTVECALCPVGSACVEAGTSLATLPLKAGYYRTGNDSDDLRRCPDAGANSGCVGGVRGGEGPCKPSLQGPYCQLCEVRDDSEYYNTEESKCLPCEGNLLLTVLAIVAVVVAAAGLLTLWRRLRHRLPLRAIALAGWLWRVYTQLSLRAKIKQVRVRVT